MKKAIYATSNKNEILIGFAPDYLWVSTEYYKAPHEPGRYLVIKKDGTLGELMTTGSDCTTSLSEDSLFAMAAARNLYGAVYFEDHEVTDTDLMDIYRAPWSRWYYFNEWYEYEDCHNDLYILTEDSDNYPLYFLNLNLEDKIQLDETGKVASDEDPAYFTITSDYKYIRKTDNAD